MTAFVPLPDVLYRLQNVDFGSFLELRTVTSKGEVVVRPQKDGLQQQWTFVSTSDKDSYKIQNGNLGSKRFFLTTGTTKGTISTSSVGSAKAWSINGIKGDLDQFLFVYSQAGSNDQFLYLDDTGNPKLLDEDDLLNSENPGANVRWRIREVLPSVPKDVILPKDTYRIRSLNGLALQMAANTDVVTVKQQASGDYQAWDIVPTGNGKCTIQNSAEKTAYLGWRADNKTGFAAVRKVATPETWELTSFGGGYTYSLGMTYTVDTSRLRLALSLGDDSQIALKPSKFAHNQIWLFEPTDGKGSGLPTVDGGNPPPPYEQRYPEIVNKSYYFRNQGYGNYFMYVWSGPWRVGPVASQSYQFALLYKDGTSAQFVLSYSGNYFTINNGTVVLDSTPTSWVLERNPANASQYYICVAGDPDKVITGDTTKDLNGYDRYRIDTKQKDRATQLWTLT